MKHELLTDIYYESSLNDFTLIAVYDLFVGRMEVRNEAGRKGMRQGRRKRSKEGKKEGGSESVSQ